MTASPLRQRVRVADIGGSHITAAVVELTGGPDAAAAARVGDSASSGPSIGGERAAAGAAALAGRVLAAVGADTDPHGAADEILDAWASACLGAVAEAEAGGAPSAVGDTAAVADTAAAASATTIAGWAFAMPDPFDFERGTGTFDNVAKFENLSGLDLRGELARRLDADPATVRFVHDAGAYGIGEWMFGAAAGHDRAVVITLGTGVGSTFLDHGSPVAHRPDVPTNGTVHLLHIDGAPLEDTVSTRALLAAYARAAAVAPAPSAAAPADVAPAPADTARAATPATAAAPAIPAEPISVKQIAERARAGEPAAAHVFEHAFFELGAALAPWLAAFEATVLVAGGSMSRSWDLLEPPLRAGIAATHPALAATLTLAASPLLDDAPLLGAAAWLTRRP